MAQNSRHRKATLPKKAVKSRRDSTSSSSLDLSSDGGYSALDEVDNDDDDDDDNDVYAAEEEAIIKDVTKHRHIRTSRSTVQQKEDKVAVAVEDNSDEDADDDDDEDDEDDDDDDPTDIPVNDEDDFSSGPDINAEDSFGILDSDINNGQSSTKRHVRFAGVSDSENGKDNESDNDSSASITSDGFFPDVFVDKQSLDTSFRRALEEDSDSSNSITFWDYTAGNTAGLDTLPAEDVAHLVASEAAVSAALGNFADGVDNEADYESDSDFSDLDGYDSDGDTTEEDEPQLLPPRRKTGYRNAQPHDDDSSDSDEDFVPLRNRRGHPRVGRYALSNKRSKPIAVINPITKKMVIFTPDAPKKTEELPTQPIHLNLQYLPMNGNSMIQSSPLQHHSNTMLFSDTAPVLNNSGIIHSDPLGTSLGAYNEDSDDFSAEFGEEPGEQTLRMEDFICFDRNSTEPDAALGAAPVEAPIDFFDGPDSVDAALDSLFDTAALDATLASLPAEDVEAAINGLFGDNADLPDNPFFETGMGFAMDLSSSITGGDGSNDQEDGETPALTPRAATPGGSNAALFAAVTDPSPATANAEPDSPPPHPLMTHFSKNTDVGAFRRNQINQQLISSNKATEESLAFSGPLSMGTLRGIKNGSLGAVSAPLTPPRRPKRKAHESALDGPSSHKRYRSISEVKDMTL